MRPDDFAPSQRRHVRRAERGYYAFVPPPLPPDLTMDTELVALLSGADHAIGRLSGLGHGLPNPYLMSQALVRREAVLSSRIEGTHATLSDLALFEVEQPAHPRVDDVREVFNYVEATGHVLNPRRRLPLSLPLLTEAHAILMNDLRGGYATPGEFRRTQNWIGRPGATLDDATYVPPPPEELWSCLDAFEKHLHADRHLPPLITIACLHYQFEAIHPFLDGNGRLGRLLVALLLVEWGLLPAPLLDLSAYLEKRRDEYYARLLAVSREGDWRGWITFFLTAFADQARDAMTRAHALIQLRERLREATPPARTSGSRLRLIDELFTTPAMTINRARKVLGVTHRAAANNVARLVDDGILEEVTSTGRTRLFLAPRILRLVNGEHDPAGNDT